MPSRGEPCALVALRHLADTRTRSYLAALDDSPTHIAVTAERGLLDEAWYVTLDDTERQRRLLERHMRFGRERADALQWIATTDEPNARLVAASKHRADWVIEQAN